MITSWDIYWITRLDGIDTFFASILIISIILVVSGALLGAFWADDKNKDGREEAWTTYRKYLKRGIIAVLFIAIPALFLPSTKEFAAIYLLPKIVNNEQVQKIPDNLATLLNAKMEAWIKDIGSKNGRE